VLQAQGIDSGDRVGIILPQRPETAISHLAVYKIGAIAIPLARLFGPEALKYRLYDSSTRAVITDGENLFKIIQIRENLPALERIFLVDGTPQRDEIVFEDAVARASSEFETTSTKADDPAVIIYTSGTTGPPKGALHAHRYFLGHLPGFELSHNFFPKKGDLGWTPADWAWIGGLMDLLMPCWYYGFPVLAYQGKKFDPQGALSIMEKYRVRNVFMPPTALRMIRQVSNIRKRYTIELRTMIYCGEALGAETLEWTRKELGVGINEIYGQTEANYMVGNCQKIFEVRPGSMGRPYPGHIGEIMDDEGRQVPAGEVGEIVFKKNYDPAFFLGYWNNPEGTREKFKGEWSCSGDFGTAGWFLKKILCTSTAPG
jgi:acetyl-CoA synthetase